MLLISGGGVARLLNPALDPANSNRNMMAKQESESVILPSPFWLCKSRGLWPAALCPGFSSRTMAVVSFRDLSPNPGMSSLCTQGDSYLPVLRWPACKTKVQSYSYDPQPTWACIPKEGQFNWKYMCPENTAHWFLIQPRYRRKLYLSNGKWYGKRLLDIQ